MVTVTSDYSSSPHQIAPPLHSDTGEETHISVQLPHPSNITLLNFCVDLVVSPLICHMHFVPQSSFSYSNDTILCFSIMDSTLVLNEYQAIDGVGTAQPTCTIIHEEYDRDLEHQHLAKDDSLLYEPPMFFPNIFGKPAIHDSHVYLHLQMHPFFIIRRTHQKSVHHLKTERINYSLKIHFIFHLPFLET